jgi:hypothetical protein
MVRAAKIYAATNHRELSGGFLARATILNPFVERFHLRD